MNSARGAAAHHCRMARVESLARLCSRSAIFQDLSMRLRNAVADNMARVIVRHTQVHALGLRIAEASERSWHEMQRWSRYTQNPSIDHTL